MPKVKDINDVAMDFRSSLEEKYGYDSVTPEIYKKEVLKFVSQMDPTYAFENVVEFINLSALFVSNSRPNNDNVSLAKDKSMAPIDFMKGLVNKTTPTKELSEAIGKSMTVDDYINMCNSLTNDNPDDVSKENLITKKINKFKTLEALKPTGNSFTKFFKKLFNIGGYKEKLAAYESCKQSLKEFVGNGLTNEQFEEAISNDQPFSSMSLAKEEPKVQVERRKINIDEVDKAKVEVEGKEKKQPQKEIVNELNK